MFEKPLFIRAEWDEDVNVWVATIVRKLGSTILAPMDENVFSHHHTDSQAFRHPCIISAINCLQ